MTPAHKVALFRIAILSFSSALAACNGDGGGQGEVTPVVQAPLPAGTLALSSATYSSTEGGPAVVITVNRVGGSAGPVSVRYSTSDGTATSAGDYNAASGVLVWAADDAAPKTFTVGIFDDAVSEGTEFLNLKLSENLGGAILGQSAAVLTIADNDGGGGGSSSVSGLITDIGTGARLSGVTVTATPGAGSSAKALVTATTNAKGEFTLNGLPAGTQQISVAKAGYAQSFETPALGDKPAIVVAALKKEGASQPYSTGASGPTTLTETTAAGPYSLIIQPNSLDTTDTNLRISVTPLDPTRELSALPGDLVRGDGVVLQPATFAEFTIRDSAGHKVNLKPGSTAIVEMPIPPDSRSSFHVGDPIHCYSYNPQTGKWEDFVDGVVAVSSVDNSTPVLRASIRHFSWYGGAPEIADQRCVTVHVVNATGPLVDARVEASPGSIGFTDANGDVQIAVKAAQKDTKYVATKTRNGTDGSLIIDFGQVIETVSSTVVGPCPATPPPGPPVIVHVAPLTDFSYTVNAYLQDIGGGSGGFTVVSINLVLPDGSHGSAVTGATVTLRGPGDPVVLQQVGTEGSYSASGFTVVSGQRYTLQIDIGSDGTIDGSGSAYALGNLAWVNPTDGSSRSAATLVAQWSDSVTAPDYVGNYYALLADNDQNNFDFAYYFGSDRMFTPRHYLDSTLPLTPGAYSGYVYAFSGAYDFGRAEVTHNITGANVSGDFYTFGFTSIDFTLTP